MQMRAILEAARLRPILMTTLLLVPVLYELTHRKAWKQQLAAGEA